MHVGNWRTVNIVGTIDPAEVEAARRYLAVDRYSQGRTIGPLSISEGLCSLGDWPAPTVMAVGNLFERNYSVRDVADHLSKLLDWAPSARLKVHCGADHEDETCVATITVEDGRVTVGDPVSDDVTAGRLLNALTERPH